MTVRKVSGEPINQNSFNIKDTSLNLILSYSAYSISVRALNSAGSSPISSIAIEKMDEWRGTLLSYFAACYMQSTLVKFTLCPMSKCCIFEYFMRVFAKLLKMLCIIYLFFFSFLDSFGLLSVNITRNNSFSLSWSSSVSSVCYSVEWWAKGQIPAFRPFYEKRAHREITDITESSTVPFYSPINRVK